MSFGHWVFLGWHIFLRDFRIRYRRTLFGFIWAVVPVGAMAVGISIMGSKVGLNSDMREGPYLLMVLLGLVLFQVFSESVNAPIQIVRRCRVFLRKTPFAYEGILVASFIRVGISLSLKLPLVVAVYIYLDIVPDASLIAAGLGAIIMLATAGVSIGAFLVPLNLVFLDIRYSLPYVQMLILLACPIFYALPEQGLLRGINLSNPLTYLVLPARSWLLGVPSELLTGFAVVSICTLMFSLVAVAQFRRGIPLAISQI